MAARTAGASWYGARFGAPAPPGRRAHSPTLEATRGGALALRRTDVGAIGPGMLADFAILDDDPLAVATDRLPDVAVDQTWVAGRRAWPSDGASTY